MTKMFTRVIYRCKKRVSELFSSGQQEETNKGNLLVVSSRVV